jgi:acyl carrier protein
MKREEVMAQVARIIAKQFNIKEGTVGPETTAFDVPGWDSLAHVYLILEIERTCSTQLPAEAAVSAANVGELVDLVVDRIARLP